MTKRDPDFEKEQGEVYGRVWKEEREGRSDVKYIGATKYKLQLFFVLFVCVMFMYVWYVCIYVSLCV